MTLIRTLTYLLHTTPHPDPIVLTLAEHQPPTLAIIQAFAHLLHTHPAHEDAIRTAIRTLANTPHPTATWAIHTALQNPSGPVRLQALHALDPDDTAGSPLLIHHLTTDPAPLIRQACVSALAARNLHLALLPALTDPVWRVRRTAIKHLLSWSTHAPQHTQDIRRALPTLPQTRALIGARDYLEWCWRGHPQGSAPPYINRFDTLDIWDPDPAVLRHNLHHSPTTPQNLSERLPLLSLQDGYPLNACLEDIRAHLLKAIQAHGNTEHWRTLFLRHQDPRLPFQNEWLDPVRQHTPVIPTPTRPEPDYIHRAATLTPAQAQTLWTTPEIETSWHVLQRAAQLLNRELAEIAPPAVATPLPLPTPPTPQPRTRSYWPPRPTLRPYEPSDALHSPISTPTRSFPGLQHPITPLILSGRYGLGAHAFDYAVSHGINTLFWEPPYAAQTQFIRALPPHLRAPLSIFAGTFEMTPAAIRRDVEEALRLLRVDRLACFFLFWVRSIHRLSEAALETLLTLQDQGLIETFGCSTHDRAIATLAIDAGWPVLMIRLSAAHHAAEQEFLPHALHYNTSLITFSNMCYGRMNFPRGNTRPPFEPSDCYRYALSQPGVIATISGPRTLRELKRNLPVLHTPTLSSLQCNEMRAYVVDERHKSRMFKALISSR